MKKIDIEVNLKEQKNFGFILVFGFFILGYLIPLFKHHHYNFFLLFISIITLILTLFVPHLLKWPRYYWLKVGNILGELNTTIIFTIIYFSIFSLINLLFKVIKRDRLQLKWKKYNTTYIIKDSISSFDEPF